MPSFIPFAGKNSIVEAVFGLGFAQPIAPAIGEKFEPLKTEFSDEFPSFEKMQMFQITLPGSQFSAPGAGPSPMPVSAGFTGSKFKSDGTPSRMFRGMANSLTTHFLEYEHWDDTAPRSMGFFLRALSIVGLPSVENPIVGVGLRFIDRFTFDGNPSEASANELLKKTTHFVAPKIMTIGPRWHSNSGWFEPIDGEQEVLHQLDISGALEQSAAIIINHNMNCTLLKPISSLTNGDSRSKNLIANLFDKQHAANASVLRDLISNEMLRAIGLEK